VQSVAPMITDWKGFERSLPVSENQVGKDRQKSLKKWHFLIRAKKSDTFCGGSFSTTERVLLISLAVLTYPESNRPKPGGNVPVSSWLDYRRSKYWFFMKTAYCWKSKKWHRVWWFFSSCPEEIVPYSLHRYSTYILCCYYKIRLLRSAVVWLLEFLKHNFE